MMLFINRSIPHLQANVLTVASISAPVETLWTFLDCPGIIILMIIIISQ